MANANSFNGKWKYGIFKTITDKCGSGPGSNDEMPVRSKKLYEELLKNHEPNVKVFQKDKKSKVAIRFIIKHSAKDVTYDAKNFIERNSDSMSGSLNTLLLEKCDPTIKLIYSMKTGFEPEEPPVDPKEKKR